MRYKALAAICGGTLFNSQRGDASFNGVSIDSRTIHSGQLFIAIRGEMNDGHDYIMQAIDAGANGVLAEFSYPGLNHITGEAAVVAVHNSHEAMLKLAADYRNNLKAACIGITGSNGKTTTKELCYRLLSAVEEKTYRSSGNLNNLFGVPLALFAIDKDAKAIVLELGISTTSEMPKLAALTHPDIALFTNVSASHLEFLSTVEEVAQAKLKLVNGLNKNGKVIINKDDPVLFSEASKVCSDFVTYSLTEEADFTVENIETLQNGTSKVTIQNNDFYLPLIGRHQVYNLLAAYAAVSTLGYSFYEVDTSALSLETAPMRGEMIQAGSRTIIADCYNANPASMKAGLEAFSAVPSDKRRVLILGDMLELGKTSQRYHEEIGDYLNELSFDLLVTVGPMAKYIQKNCNLSTGKRVQYKNSNEATSDILTHLLPDDLIYIKASRGVGLDAVLNILQNEKVEG